MKNSILLFLILLAAVFFPLNSFSQNGLFDGMKVLQESPTVKKSNKKLFSNDVDGALAILDKAIEEKVDLPDAYRERAFIRRMYKKDFQGALADLNSALEIKPDDADLYKSRAFTKITLKDYEGALKDYDSAIKNEPDNVELYLYKIELKTKLKDFEGAMTDLRSALKASPDSIMLHLSLSHLYEKKGEFSQSVASLQNFLDEYTGKHNGKFPKIRGEKVIKKIPSEFKSSDGSDRSIQVTRYSQKHTFITSGKDLIDQLEKEAEARDLAEAFIALGRLYILTGDNQKAVENLTIALDINPNSEKAFALRGVVYLSNSEYEKAIKEFDEAIDIADDPTFYLNRGIAFLMISNDKKAQKDFDKFLKIYPEGKELLDKRIAEAKQKLKPRPLESK